jgi:hypothetical protein
VRYSDHISNQVKFLRSFFVAKDRRRSVGHR